MSKKRNFSEKLRECRKTDFLSRRPPFWGGGGATWGEKPMAGGKTPKKEDIEH